MKGLKKAMVSDYRIIVSHIPQASLASERAARAFYPALFPLDSITNNRTCPGQRVIPNRNHNHLSHLLNRDSIPPIPIPLPAHPPPPLHLPLIDQVDRP